MVSFLLNVSILLILFSSVFLAQTDSAYIKAEEVLEDVLHESDDDLDKSNLYEFIEQLLLNPIEINSSTISEIQQIPGLDAEAASLIYKHRLKYGNFFSIDELNAVRGLDSKIIDKIKPFLTVDKKLPDQPTKEEEVGIFKNIIGKSKIMLRSRFSKDLQLRKGFINNSFQGPSYKTYNRLLINYENTVRMGVLIEKDPGEIGINEFSSYHLFIGKSGLIKQAVLGDYLIESGQGLVFWSPYGFSKGADAIYPVKKRTNRIRPYTSATENNFLRGAAGAVEFYDFTLTA
ncbi:ComEA family DNA-binding protein, partial [Bacteroidota bacterium]